MSYFEIIWCAIIIMRFRKCKKRSLFSSSFLLNLLILLMSVSSFLLKLFSWLRISITSRIKIPLYLVDNRSMTSLRLAMDFIKQTVHNIALYLILEKSVSPCVPPWSNYLLYHRVLYYFKAYDHLLGAQVIVVRGWIMT